MEKNDFCLDGSTGGFDESAYRAMVAVSPEAALLITPQGSVLMANREAQSLFTGTMDGSICGNDFFAYLAESDSAPLQALSSTLRQVGATAGAAEVQLARTGDTPLWAALSFRKVTGVAEIPGLLLVLAHDITDRKKTESLLRDQTFMDDLTGLLNRRGFKFISEQEIRHAHRTGNALALLFFDMDDLKTINDTFGHLEGDAAIRGIADIMRESFRESDVICRWGGDEFVILALDIPEGSVPLLLQRFEGKLAGRNALPDARYQLSVSSGMSRYVPGSPMPLPELLKIADEEMYREKRRRGRR